MTTWLFDGPQIAAWCRLSGDDNAIHRDTDAARRMGAPGIVVPGMLAMMHAQQALSWVLPPPTAPKTWWQSRMRLKRPVPANRSVNIAARRSARGAKVALSDDTGAPYYAGTLETGGTREIPVEPAISETLTFEPTLIDAASLARMVNELAVLAPPCDSPWVILSACVFAQILPGVRRGLEPLIERRESLRRRDFTLLHTAHSVRFDAVRLTLPAWRHVPLYRCNPVEAPVYEVADHLVVQVPYDILAGTTQVMRVEATLIFMKNK